MSVALEVRVCSRCDRDSIIHQPYSGLHLCGTHLIESVRKRIAKSLRKQLILPKNSIKSIGRPFRILVAISGGKDSAILLYFMHSLLNMRRDVELIAGVVDEGIDGLVHVSDLSWTKVIKHPKEVVEKGQEIDLEVKRSQDFKSTQDAMR